MNQTIIYLTEEDARLFVQFQKSYMIFRALIEAEALEIRNGSVTLNFDANGAIRAVKKELHYRN